MHHSGIKIHLHCFEYGRGQQQELNRYCEEVHYYKREKRLTGFLQRLPYIVSSRKNPHLLRNLLKDKEPLLLEGIHCTYYLYNGALQNRKVLVRLHNVEFEYYHQLAKSTKNIFKRIYFSVESNLLKRYEAAIANKAKLLAVNEKDKLFFQNEFGAKDVKYLPVFLPFTNVKSKTGKGTFCLYQGNLSVPENEKAVTWLLKNVFNDLKINFVAAGKNPSASLKNLLNNHEKVRLVENPSEEKMEELIENAHIHLLPSFNSTGIKIKLLNALFGGRFIITNQASLDGTGLETLCEIAETPTDYKKIIQQLSTISFSEEEIFKRNSILQSQYNTNKNVQQLMEWIYGNVEK